jgi:SAM-dependent methyltransferase
MSAANITGSDPGFPCSARNSNHSSHFCDTFSWRLHNRGLTPFFALRARNRNISVAIVSPNEYSRRWHETFSRDLDGSADVSFLARWLPPGRVLDVCCGFGRHKRGLEARGWEVVGVERDPEVAAAAGALCLDVRELSSIEGVFDGVICMWASFGHFSPAENRRVLMTMIEKLRPGGRLVLELYNRSFFEPRQGTRALADGVVETKRVERGRLFVHLDYPDGDVDEMEWELFTPSAIRDAVGLTCIHEDASREAPRMTHVFER